MNVIVFEDARVSNLYPITIGRTTYAVTCGGYRLVDWLRKLELPLRGIVRPHLQEIQRVDFEDLDGGKHDPQQPTLFVNARIVPSRSTFRELGRLIKQGQPGIVRDQDSIVAAIFPSKAPHPPSQVSVDELEDFFNYAGATTLSPLDAKFKLIEYPHDIVRYNLECISENLEYRIAHGNFTEIADGIFAAKGAKLGDYVTHNSKHGPIVLEEDANVGAYCYLEGPCLLGRKARVIEHSAIKDAVSIGHTTKIGGEVEASVIGPYTNKQHYGFLGHSYLGSWINLGAGTCNSDLKNTYGKVKMEYRGEKISTGMQFVGCMMGDYAKSAINTGIFTGKTIGTCSMVYGFVTTNVPSFVNYARLFGQVTELPPEVMIATQQRMFVRRDVTQRPCDAQLLHDMYDLTRDERQLAGEPLSL